MWLWCLCDVLCFWYVEEGGWVGLGCFLWTVLGGGGGGLCWEIVLEGGELGGVFEERGGRASGWCMVMVLGGVRDGRRGNGDVRVLGSGAVGRGNEGMQGW